MNRPKAMRFFPDWYGTAHPNPSSELIEMRLKCIAAAVADIDRRDAAGFARELLRMNSSDSLRDDLARQFSDIDKAFPATHNANLINVMLAGCIASILDSGGPCATSAALTLKAMTLSGKGRSVEPPELLVEALTFLVDEGTRVREAAHRSAQLLPTLNRIPAIEMVPANVEDIPDNQWPLASKNDKALAAAITSGHTAVATLRTSIEALRNDLETALGRDRALQALQEETEVLWWLFSGWSDIGNRPFSQLTSPSGSLVLGYDFARLTRFVPGHPRSPAILAKAVAMSTLPATPINLATVVSDGSTHLRTQLAEVRRHSDTPSPLILAIFRSAETSGDSWRPAFESVVGVSTELTATPTEWADQFYDEILLHRTLSDATS